MVSVLGLRFLFSVWFQGVISFVPLWLRIRGSKLGLGLRGLGFRGFGRRVSEEDAVGTHVLLGFLSAAWFSEVPQHSIEKPFS